MVARIWDKMPRARLMATLFVALVLVYPINARATDKNPPAAYDQSDTTPDQRESTSNQHVEGHIAFLKAELRITPAQEQLWISVADAMREDVKEMKDAEKQVAHQTQGHETTIEYLQNRVLFANLRAQGEERFLTALQPLYDNFSSQQKKCADELLVSNSRDP